MSEFAWFRRDMPWLGPGFIHCVHEDAEQALRDDLARLRFEVFTLDGATLTDAAALHRAFATTFAFPEWCGAGWDAFEDVFDDPPLPPRSALLWAAAEHLAAADLKAFAEAVCILHTAGDALKRDQRQFELFLLGGGPGFRRPTDPVTEDWRRLPL